MKKKARKLGKTKEKSKIASVILIFFFYLLLSLPLPLFIALPASTGSVTHKLWTCLNSDENLPSYEAFSLDKSPTKSRATWALWVGLLTWPNEKPSKLRIDFASCVITVIGLWQSSCCSLLVQCKCDCWKLLNQNYFELLGNTWSYNSYAPGDLKLWFVLTPLKKDILCHSPLYLKPVEEKDLMVLCYFSILHCGRVKEFLISFSFKSDC